MVPWNKIAEFLREGAFPPGKEILEWIEESPENKRLFNEIIEIWLLTGVIPAPFSPDKAKAWKKISLSIDQRQNQRLFKRLYKVAVILAAIAIGFLFHAWVGSIKPEQTVEVLSPMGQKSCVILPDGSKVTLNGGTSLKYPARFESREVKMELSGEAFFEITGNGSREFIVNTTALSINVTGTEFNVKSYRDDSEIEIALEEGSIMLLCGQKKVVTLKPNQAASYSKLNGKIGIQNADMDVITAWKKDELVFDNTPFYEVAKYLERYYGVNVNLDSALGNSHNFTFKLKTESLRETLRLLSLMSPISYTINGKKVEIYTKK